MNGASPKMSQAVVVPDSSEVTGLQGRHRLQKSKATPRNARYLRTGSWVEQERKNLQAYEYLCHIGEVKEWIEKVIGEEIATITSLDEDLRNGIVLAKLVRHFHPECVKRIFEGERLQYRHSDNINYVFSALNKTGLPDNFKFELTDLYEKKNIPKVIYCLHALSHLLFKRGLAPSINNLVGYLQFTDEQLVTTQKQLDNSGVALPAFKKVRSQLAREMNEPITMSATELDLSSQFKNIQAIQGMIRGFNTRQAWLQRDESVEPCAIDVQSRCRGFLIRKHKKEKKMLLKKLNSSIVQLQAQCKAVAVRSLYHEKIQKVQQHSANLATLQALCQGALARRKISDVKSRLDKCVQQQGIHELQAVCRSVLSRRKVQASKDKMNQAAPIVKLLQANARRHLVQQRYREKKALVLAQTENVIQIQAASRRFLARKRLEENKAQFQENTLAIQQLQANARRRLAQQRYKEKKALVLAQTGNVIQIQAAARSFLARKRFENNKAHFQENTLAIQQLQANARRRLAQQRYKEKKALVLAQTGNVIQIQAAARSFLARKRFENNKAHFQENTLAIQQLQANARRRLAQQRYKEKKALVLAQTENAIQIQAAARSFLARKRFENNKAHFQENTLAIQQLQANARRRLAQQRYKEKKALVLAQTGNVIQIQAAARSFLARKRFEENKAHFQKNTLAIQQLQALSRRNLIKKVWSARMQELDQFSNEIITMQALAKGLLVRARWTKLLADLSVHESRIMRLQAIARGFLSRKTAATKMEHYQEHEDTVVKIQSVFRAKMAKRAYYEMSMTDDPPVSAMRNFLYLLDDSEMDFTAELELEKLRQKVVRTIRENKTTEAELAELDIKIALLVKNRITIDEVVKSSKGLFQSKRSSSFNLDASAPGSSSSTNLANVGGAFSLKNLDRDSRNRLKNYQFLFYLLQTQPVYLARLLVFNKSQMGDRAKKFIETVVLTLFNFAQNNREEYLLLRLFRQSIQEEINSVEKIEEFLRGNPVFIQLAVHYNRGAKERKYLRDLLQPIIKPILEDKDLDLETDPVCIYRGVIREEESRTGTKSKRKYNVTKQSALNDPETKAAFIKHLQQLRTITSDVIDAILKSLDTMPYGVRYIAKELKLALTRKFPEERPSTIIKVVGHLVYYRYINPAITAPELFDVIETVINSIQRKNLAEIAKMLNQVSMGKLFSDENIFLQPLNNFIGFTAEKFARYFQSVTEVDDPNIHFGIDEFMDQVSPRKPTIYISYNEIISLHRLLHDNEELISPDVEDPIHPILQKLGSPPQLMNFEDRSLGKEIALVLSDPAGPASARREEAQQIFLESKRQVLYVIKIQSGATLLEILTKSVSAEDELKYTRILEEEIERNAFKQSPPQSPSLSEANSIAEGYSDALTNDFIANLRRLTLSQLKEHILKNMESLESAELVSKDNGYQAIVNSIARDIKNKHQRRKQRTEEFRKVRQTLGHLNDASSYYAEQRDSYHSYISTCMSNLRAGKTKGRHRARPFSKQYFHAKGLERAGKMPKFGSYKYGADDLYRRGILISIAKFSPSDFGKMSLTISSDEMGVFHVEASLLGIKVPNAKVELRFDELLQAQFENVQTLSLFDDTVKVNVNLLLYLINKKFYT